MDGPEPLIQYAVPLLALIVLPPGQEQQARELVAGAVQAGREKNPDSKIYLAIGPGDKVQTYRENDAARRLKRASTRPARGAARTPRT